MGIQPILGRVLQPDSMHQSQLVSGGHEIQILGLSGKMCVLYTLNRADV